MKKKNQDQAEGRSKRKRLQKDFAVFDITTNRNSRQQIPMKFPGEVLAG
jgi:hypothetical protein